MPDYTSDLDAAIDQVKLTLENHDARITEVSSGTADYATVLSEVAGLVEAQATTTAAVSSVNAALTAYDDALSSVEVQATDLSTAVAALILRAAAVEGRVAALENPAPPPPPPPPPPPGPVSAFTLNKTSGVAPLQVVMTQQCANADHYQMDWGGGTPTPVGIVHPLSDTTVTHDYPNPGTYSLTLKAWRDSDGKEATSSGTITVGVPAPVTGTVGKLFGGISLPLAQSPATDISRIAGDGFGWYRFDVPIRQISPTKGTYNWTSFDSTFAACVSAGLKINAICYMLPQWMNGSTDDKVKPTNLQDYADWCGGAAVAMYAKGVRSMELWNEQNWGFWKPTPDRALYVDMAIRAADAIHAAEPRMIVVSGGLSTADTEAQAGRATQGGYTSPWPGANQTLDHYGRLGLFAHVDAVGIHPYLDDVDPTPTGGAEWMQWAGGAMRTTIGIIDKWAPEGKKLTVWNTESACPLVRSNGSTITQTEKANRAAHAFQAFRLWKMADGSPMWPRLGPYFYFTYKYWTANQPPREATFGLVDTNYVAQPIRAAVMGELSQVLS